MPNLGPMEIAIIAIVIVLLFGGAKLAGLGKSTGRAIREFKEETKGLREDKKESAKEEVEGVTVRENDVVDAEIVESTPAPRAEA